MFAYSLLSITQQVKITKLQNPKCTTPLFSDKHNIAVWAYGMVRDVNVVEKWAVIYESEKRT